MNRKLVGILVCTLLIATTLPVVGLMNIGRTMKTEPNDPQPGVIKTGYLSVPAGAYVAEEETTNYYNWGSYMYGDGWFYAPVYLLEEDTTVTKLTFYWDDTSGADAHLLLIRYPIGGGVEDWMVDIWSSGSGGVGFTEENTITFPNIDNSQYSYFLALYLDDPPKLEYFNVVIEYTYDVPVNSDEISEGQQTQEFQGSYTR
jgi:hypothetical protein